MIAIKDAWARYEYLVNKDGQGMLLLILSIGKWQGTYMSTNDGHGTLLLSTKYCMARYIATNDVQLWASYIAT